MRYWRLAERSTKENGELWGVFGGEYYVTTKNLAVTKVFYDTAVFIIQRVGKRICGSKSRRKVTKMLVVEECGAQPAGLGASH